MKTIIVTSQKGGSGKTTLAAHLAVEVERAGDGPAWLIDTDKQATLSLWHERRESEKRQRSHFFSLSPRPRDTRPSRRRRSPPCPSMAAWRRASSPIECPMPWR